jgi:parallel beta-helix repeat protein
MPLTRYEARVKANPRTWTVDDDGPADFNKIQTAIDNASSGDTIFVHEGTYYENISINKSLAILGEDANSTIIDGFTYGSVVSIMADNVNFTSFTVKNSGTNLYDSAIRIEHSSGIVISYNNLSENPNGISLYFSSHGTISKNVIASNTFHGIYVYSSEGNTITNNVILGNYAGVYAYSSGGSIITNNVILDNLYGIYGYSSTGEVISGNTIFYNLYGIYFVFSGYNIVYHNNLNNTNQAWGDSLNSWDYNGEGNYWSDYTGPDTNADGFGDYPYSIEVSNQDNNPLMGMFSDLEVEFKGQTYHLAVISNSTISGLLFEIGVETGNKIIRFNVNDKTGTIGFCRVTIPTELMNYPYILLIGSEEITPTLNISNDTHAALYFTYIHENQTIRIISSVALQLYTELLNSYLRLQTDFHNLNLTYNELLNTYNALLKNYTQLQRSLDTLNASYLQFYSLNASFNVLLNAYNALLANYTQLQGSYNGLNNSYQEHLLDYSEKIQNIQSLMYIVIAIITIFVVTIVYLSKRAHTGAYSRARAFEIEK